MVSKEVVISGVQSLELAAGSPLLHVARDDEHLAIQAWASWGV